MAESHCCRNGMGEHDGVVSGIRKQKAVIVNSVNVILLSLYGICLEYATVGIPLISTMEQSMPNTCRTFSGVRPSRMVPW